MKVDRWLQLITPGIVILTLSQVTVAASLDRKALPAISLLNGQPIFFVVRHQYRSDHHNTETMFQTGEINTGSFTGGSALKTIDLATGVVKTLVELPEGVVRDPDVSFDGRKILVSIRRNRSDDYHIHELNADGSGLRQLTTGQGISDIDPIYLPDGRILFTSTREPKYCMCNRHIMGNLFTMESDGTNIQQIGHSTLHEGHASLLPDGRVIYDRWEYVDRNFGNAQGLWTCNPDGTNHVLYYGNSTASPGGGKLEARVIPGTQTVICTLAACHDRPWGALAILDRSHGSEGREPVVRTWPANVIESVGRDNDYDRCTGINPKYEDPYPLSDRYFLCARMTGHGEQMGIYLLDTRGDDILLHVEGLGCFDPMPLGPRPRPPVIPSRIDLANKEGYFYVADVYQGTGMEKIPRGTVKRLRVVESPEKRFWTDPGYASPVGAQAPGMAWKDFNNKRVLGSVPVEPDGSAHFAVPADRFVYFQLVDDKGLMIQSMRSGTIVRPGERTGCTGCHESRQQTSSTVSRATAMHRPPSKLELAPWLAPARNFGYTAEVQPVFDRQCVSCHDYGKEAGHKLNLAGDLNSLFNTSYVELRAKDLVRVINAGPPEVQMPKSWGSHVSRLAAVLLRGHGKAEIDGQVKLTPEDIERVLTWIDINAPYYAEYAGGAYRQNAFGRCPLDNGILARLQQLTGAANLADDMAALNFTRPELSPCLGRIADRNDPRYQEALKIIRSGKEKLARDPRPDMPNFRLTDPTEVAQQHKYDALRSAESAARAAIVSKTSGVP
jgi:hypothetical protein